MRALVGMVGLLIVMLNRRPRTVGVALAACGFLVPSIVQASTGVVRGEKAAVRAAPAAIAPVIETLARGQRIEVSDPNERGWRRAVLIDGRFGYIEDSALDVAGDTSQPPPGASSPPRRLRPWIVRFELDLAGEHDSFLFPESENEAGGVEVTLGRNFTERLSAELTTGVGVSVALWPGFVTMGLGRAAILIGSTFRRSALTVAAGPMLIAGGKYDTVAFTHAEIGYEYRGNEGTFLLSVGPDVALNDSAPQSTTGCGSSIFGADISPCVMPFKRGDVFLHFRLGFGFAFGG